MRFQFMHAADLHLDTPFTGVHRVDAQLAAKLQNATIQAFDNLVAAALERSVAFVVIAGDVYDGPERGVRAQLAFRDGLKRLAQAGIRSFVVHGNHDPVDEGWSAVRQWPDGVTVFGSEEVATISVERDGQTLALIHGISYSRRAVTENLALRFRRSPLHCFQIGVLHCNAGANAEHAPYSPCSVEDLVASRLDYWALGHVHIRQLLRSDGPWIAYPGNLQGLSRKASECGAKGALVVDVEDVRVAGIDFVAMDVVRFDDLEIDIAEIPDIANLIDALVDAARDRGGAHDGRAVVLRVAITGRGALHRDLHRHDVREIVLGPARAALGDRKQSVWLDVVEDRTRPEIDIEALRGRRDFTADLIETGDSVLAAPSARNELLASSLDDLPRGGLRHLIGDAADASPTEDEIRKSLETALDRLTGVE